LQTNLLKTLNNNDIEATKQLINQRINSIVLSLKKISYNPRVKKLLHYNIRLTFPSHKSASNKWPNYIEIFGFESEDIPELIQMATDPKIYKENESATIHAYRALAQLKAEAAMEPLFSLFQLEDDFIENDLPDFYALLGEKSIPLLIKKAQDPFSTNDRQSAVETLGFIAEKFPARKSEIISELVKILEMFEENSPVLNGITVAVLIDLKAKDALPTIKKVYDRNCADIMMCGDYKAVKKEIQSRYK